MSNTPRRARFHLLTQAMTALSNVPTPFPAAASPRLGLNSDMVNASVPTESLARASTGPASEYERAGRIHDRISKGNILRSIASRAQLALTP